MHSYEFTGNRKEHLCRQALPLDPSRRKTQATRVVEFDMGHRVPNHASKCYNVHGHRYRVEMTLEGYIDESDSETKGMVLDFSTMKKDLNDVCDKYLDHAYMGEEGKDDQFFFYLEAMEMKHLRSSFTPTAENLAQFIANEMDDVLYCRYASAYDNQIRGIERDTFINRSMYGEKMSKADKKRYDEDERAMAADLEELQGKRLNLNAHRPRVTNLRLYETPNGFADAQPNFGWEYTVTCFTK